MTTKISKMVMGGFKSFATKTELVFGDNYNCVLGPNGCGKCVTGDTVVQLADGSLAKIGELVNNKLKASPAHEIDDGVVAMGDGLGILCLDMKTLKAAKMPIQAYVKRKSPKRLLKITTRSGRSITATEYHPLFVLEKGAVQPIKAEGLKVGERVAVPRAINAEVGTEYFVELIDLITEDDEIYVSHSTEFVTILRKLKTTTWKNLSEDIKVPLNSIKGLLDSQSINFAQLVKMLRYAGLENQAIIKIIPKIKSKNGSKTFNVPWKNSAEFSRFFGYLLAEGRLTPSNQIWFTNGSPEIVEDYKRLIDKLFGLKATVNEYKPNCWDVIAYSNPLIKILAKFGMSRTTTIDKRITNLFLSHSSDEELAELLNGLYSGDGYVAKGKIQIVSKSPELASAIENILLRLGINFNSRYVVKMATNSGFCGIYKEVSVYGVSNFITFHDKIRLCHRQKQERIKGLLNVKGNPNLDLLEVNELVKNAANELKINVKKTKKQFPRLDSYCYNQCTPSREGVNLLVDNLFAPVSSGQQLQSLTLLQKLSTSDIFWDEIESIEQVDSKEEFVYDLCVEEHHNFIANNFFVHNSNVIDALCFVLGKGSTRELRAEKAANFIYNGGKTKQPAKEGYVSIYFDNSKKDFPTDESYVKITRIVQQSGQSKYKINDKTRTRQQVLDLLSVAKIDPDGYNIILQGDIQTFVDMPPLQRRTIIEEISGITLYEDKKSKAINELNKVEEKLNNATIVLAERKTYLDELKKDRDQAMKYKDLDEKIKANKATELDHEIKKKQNEVDKLEKDIQAQKDIVTKLQDEIKEINATIATKKDEIRKVDAEIEEKGEKQQLQIHREVEQLKEEIMKGKARVEICKSEIEKVIARKENLKTNLGTTQQKVDGLKQNKKDLEKAKQEKEALQKDIESKIAAFKKKSKIEDLPELDKQTDDLDKQSEAKEQEVQKLREQQQEFLRNKDRLEIQIQSIDEKISKVKEIEKEHKAELTKLMQLKDDFKKATLELNKKIDEDSSLAAQIGEKKARLAQVEEIAAKLRAKAMEQRESTSANIAVKTIIENKAMFGEVYGTISQLGEVNSKYSLAMDVAAGPRINSIVVGSDKIAADCIKYLRAKQLGVATFLPLNKIHEPSPDSRVKEFAKANGVHGLATDLIAYDPRFKKAFAYVFANTLVVDNIDVARRIGVGVVRMATLDGDLVESSGVMRGGYRQKKASAFREKDMSADLENAEGQIAEASKVISTLQKRRDEVEKIIEELRLRKAELEGEAIKIEKSLHLDSKDIDASKKVKSDFEKELSDINKLFEKLMGNISEVNKQLAQIKIARQQLREKISGLRDPRKLAELNTFEQKKAETTNDIATLTNEIKNIDVQVQTIFGPEQENIGKIIKQHDREEQQFKDEAKLLEGKIKEHSKGLAEKEKAESEFKAKYRNLFEKKNKINEEIQNLERDIIRKDEQILKFDEKASDRAIMHARVKAELAGLDVEFKKYEGVKLVKKSLEQLRKEIVEYEALVVQMGTVNMRALEVYEAIEKEYNELMEKKNRLDSEKLDVMNMMDEIEVKKGELFMKTFGVITDNFKKIFSELSTKGDAFLELENPEKPFEGGVRIKVRITGKKFLDIRSLSGGEKTMTALAFIFCIQEHEPAPFYVLDEVDAALDKRNSELLSKLIRKYSDKAQYIMISHNDGVISQADNLYGVTMDQFGISKVVSLKI